MVRSLLKLLGPLALVCALVAIGLSLVVIIGREHGRTISGTCPNYDCFANVFRKYDSGIHAGAMSQVPRNVRDLRYYFWAHSGRFEFRFQRGKEEFVAWAESLGWTPDAIHAHRRGVTLMVYDTEPERGPDLVDFEPGYLLISRGPRWDEFERTVVNTTIRLIAYDEASQTVYLQLWTPIPDKLINE